MVKVSEKIALQKVKIQSDESKVTLFAPCRVNEGIIQFSESEYGELRKQFPVQDKICTYFIPASGSGSRMFQFLHEFLVQPNGTNFANVERFLNHIKEFAFYHVLPIELKEKIKNNTIDASELAQFLLAQNGLNFSNSPKGLIPFHYDDPFVLNPFQEHVLQGTKLSNGNARFHFTIHADFKDVIQQKIDDLAGMTGKNYEVSYSIQRPETDAVVFDSDLNPFVENNSVLERPAGHGALIENLNNLDTELVFIKNIDNVQHFSNSNTSLQTWSNLGSILLKFKSELLELYTNFSKQNLIELNKKYQFLNENAIGSDSDLKEILLRPIRVCGMVKNEGQPGGGPFWISENGKISKQIIEKSQITQDAGQMNLMVKSTHFNPVMIALSPLNILEEKLNLLEFVDESKYFVVNKDHKGQSVKFVELPGLWNGGMANWNTLFVEIPQDTFSPVKTVLDLLDPMHLAKS